MSVCLKSALALPGILPIPLADATKAHHEKAQRYIGLLETARVAGNWQELPELIRKVTKHAPDRKCKHLSL